MEHQKNWDKSEVTGPLAKHIDNIKDLLDVGQKSGITDVNKRIINAIIEAVLEGNIDLAKSILSHKLSVEGHDSKYKDITNFPEGVADQIIPFAEEYLKENNDKIKEDVENQFKKPAVEKSQDIQSITSLPDIVNIVKKDNTDKTIETKTQEEKTSNMDNSEIKKTNKVTKNDPKPEIIEPITQIPEKVDMLSDEYVKNLKKSIAGDKNNKILNDIEKANKLKEDHEKTVKRIGEILKQGIDKVVIHGNNKEDSEGNIKLEFDADIDSRGALFLLNDIAKIKYKQNERKGQWPQTQITKKGTGIPARDELTVVHVDTGGEMLAVNETKNGKQIFIDHHQEWNRKFKTSATALMYEVLTENKMIEKAPWLDKMVGFVTDVDNLSYTQNPKYNESFFRNDWPRSLYGIYEDVPFEYIVEWFKEGRNSVRPFTKEEIETIKIKKMVTNKETKMSELIEVPLKDIMANARKQAGMALGNAKFAIEQMKKNGIVLETAELGKIVFNTLDRQKDAPAKKNPVNRIPHAFPAIRALGYDTYIAYTDKTKKFFINSIGYNLNDLHKRIKGVIPGAKLIRGVMIMPPMAQKDRENMTAEKFFEILKIKNDNQPAMQAGVEPQNANAEPEVNENKTDETPDENPELKNKVENIKNLISKVKIFEEKLETQKEKDMRDYLGSLSLDDIQKWEGELKAQKEDIIKKHPRFAQPEEKEIDKKLAFINDWFTEQGQKMAEEMLANENKNQLVTEEEFKKFTDAGEASEELLNKIAEKIKSGEKISDKDLAIYNEHSQKIESSLKNSVDSKTEIKTATQEKTPDKLLGKDELEDEIKQNIRELLNKKEVREKEPEIKKFLIKLENNICNIESIIKLNKTGSFLKPTVTINFAISLENKNGELVIGKHSIDAGRLATGSTREELEPLLPQIIPGIKKYLEDKYGKQIESMKIEDDKLALYFKKT